MENTWVSRELPVLTVIVSQLDKLPAGGGYPDADDIAAATGLDIAEVAAALNALDGEYVTLIRPVTVPAWHVTKVTSEARRAVGQWPTSDALVLRLAEAFAAAAETEPDPEQKSRLRQVASFLSSTGRDVAAEVISKVILHSAGMG